MDLIELSRNSLLVLHLIGQAALLGGFLTQLRAASSGQAKILPVMLHGAWTALAAGVLLVGLAEYRVAMGADFEVNHIKIGVKSLVMTVILVLLYAQKKKDAVRAGAFWAIGALTLANVVLAVFW
ncbi:MAG: hypothetical protein ACO324_03660 [Aquiluna sp.]